MITFDRVSVTYPGAATPALAHADLTVGEGELCLVVGPTGSGKSTLLGAACARVPHFTGGLLTGRVLLDGRDTRDHLPRDLADVVGVVGQDPVAGFVTDAVEEELAFAVEQLGLPPGVMRRRVEEVLDLLGLAGLRDRPLATLSGGEQQRVAVGAVLTAQPRVLVLDEPTSALDPGAAEEVLASLTRLVHDLGLTILLAEHRLERVVQYADRVVLLDGGHLRHGDPAAVLATSPVVPPVVELGRLAGWDPLPLSVRDARRRAAGLRERLDGPAREEGRTKAWPAAGAPPPPDVARPVLLEATGVRVDHGGVRALAGADLVLRAGDVLAVMGRNGSGKTSLLWALQGHGPRTAGAVRVTGPAGDAADPAVLPPSRARRLVALVPQNPTDLLYLDTVAAECALADAEASAAPGTARALLDELAPGVPRTAHPRDLSEGQRLALALAVQLAARPRVLLLDEPTRGLDYGAKRRLATLLSAHARGGGAVVLTTHDVEFAAACVGRVVVLAEGDVVADGPARAVLVGSPTFAPQVAKVLRPLDLLTVAEVEAQLAVAP